MLAKNNQIINKDSLVVTIYYRISSIQEHLHGITLISSNLIKVSVEYGFFFVGRDNA